MLRRNKLECFVRGRVLLNIMDSKCMDYIESWLVLKPIKVTDNSKDISLLRNLALGFIFSVDD